MNIKIQIIPLLPPILNIGAEAEGGRGRGMELLMSHWLEKFNADKRAGWVGI